MLEKFGILVSIFFSDIETKWQENLFGNFYMHNRFSNSVSFSSIVSFSANKFNILHKYNFVNKIYFGSHGRTDDLFRSFLTIFPTRSIFEESTYNIDTFGDTYIQPDIISLNNDKIFSVSLLVHYLLTKHISEVFQCSNSFNKFINFVSNYIFKISSISFFNSFNLFDMFFYKYNFDKFNVFSNYSNNRNSYDVSYLSDNISNSSLVLNVAKKRYFKNINNYSFKHNELHILYIENI